jgi:DNA-binding PadR family transcriptional regulator
MDGGYIDAILEGRLASRSQTERAMTLDVKTKCLGVLSMGNASGYEIQKEFREGAASHFVDASFGSIYPALTKLTEEGLVSCQEFQQDGRPDKKVYSITPNGRVAFRQALRVAPAEDKFRSEFLFYLLFAEQMDPEFLSDLIDRKNFEVKETLKILTESDDDESAGERFVKGYGLAVHQAIQNYLDENKDLFIDESAAETAKAV